MVTDNVKVEVLKAAAPAVVPLARVAIDQHYQTKRLDRQAELAAQRAESRADQIRTMSTSVRSPQSVAGGVRPGGGGEAADALSSATGAQQRAGDGLLDEIRRMKEETMCGFCQSALDALEGADPEAQRKGLEEIREYKRVSTELEESGASEAEVQQRVDSLVDSWEVVPRVLSMG